MVTTLLMLPKDLILSCLARISRLYYPTLSLVSKKFRSLINSPELYETRSLLGPTETCLYVCFRSVHDENAHWFTLAWRPNRSLADSSNMLLVPIPALDSPSSHMHGAVAVGPNIYAIGRSTDNASLSRVFFTEPHSHTWCEAPSMHVARESPSVCALDGKIYVIGGCKNLDSVNWMEMFDTRSKSWEFVPSPSEKIQGSSRYESVGLEGNVYVLSMDQHVAFKQHKGRWRETDLAFDRVWYFNALPSGQSSYCVIENVFYCLTTSMISWYDFNERIWRTLKGMEEFLRSRTTRFIKLVDNGGKMVVFWEEYVPPWSVLQNTSIWCAEISLERRQRWEIFGKVEWFGLVFTNTKRYDLNLMHVVATIA